jgi:dTDP-4-dehydrorhamnose 3,5-epimerase-like enzyme
LEPKLFKFQSVVDDRGSLTFCNDLVVKDFKRFYLVENHSMNFVRAWHGHLLETKLFLPIEGSFRIAINKPSSWELPSKDEEPEVYYLSSEDRKALLIPPGYYNGLQNLTQQNKLMVFSDKSLDESLGDDYRLNFDFWNPWGTNYR